jgi:hypothetical protein
MTGRPFLSSPLNEFPSLWILTTKGSCKVNNEGGIECKK